ncbi:putative nicotinamide-nucleotide adenylyltransferase [Hyphopichia burtonii NRRL Y-1933]|uniref:Nicotinamide-nucleotide adenylyltransferase n=1 Tax=Hyphopichia burtonii NRRL Y-1933 TaxID=984485 RepID=A0A1E4RGT9_9ASCO|nr:putative nicotinamide-nucleotide adenylyltransferase [Hyphopichia burtonii NRRL Y-1933]ODV66484.1 putative nicotinamide-nucleotide adenylyltransferase [Hyphopichia burtonii NRRL Y-1933]
MDPTNDPNFTPPSLNRNIEPTAPLSEIPSNAPIQPFVLADLGDSVDAPPPHPSLSEVGEDKNKEKGLESRIPRKHTDLSTSSSEEEENHPEKPINKGGKLILPPTAKVRSSQIADLEEVPHGIQRQAKSLDKYQFPTHRLATTLSEDNKYPLVIVACGSFSPITYLHLRMFEMALDAINEQTKFEVIGGYYSPVSDNYKKQGLAPSHHRVRMCELACERTSSWLMVDAWESLQNKYTRTALVLDHFNEEINIKRGGIRDSNGEKRGVKIMLLAGGDLIESMGEPDVWADQDLHHILGKYGCLIVERTGADVRSFLLSHDIMYEHRRNVLVIKQLIYNDISSTKIRLFIRRGMSVQYLLPNSVIRYIQEHKLYINETEPVKQVMSDKAD